MTQGDVSRLIGLSLAIHLAVLAGIAVRNPGYLSDYRLNDSPDARHYVQLGRNLLLEGTYSRMDGPPYAPDLLRTPVYPVVAGALDVVVGPLGIYLFQVAAQLGVVWLVFWLASIYFGRRTALWAALLAATDLMTAIYNFSALTESLFAAATLSGIALVLPEAAPRPTARGGARRLLMGGTLLALATLIRPAGLYLPALLAVAVLWRASRRSGWRRGFAAAVLVVVPSVVLVGGWSARNQALFGIARVSNVDAVGKVYMAGAGAYQVRHGVDRSTAQAMISEEFGLPTLLEVQNPWLSELSEREMDTRLRRASGEVLARYPSALVVSSLGGLAKGSVSHNVPSLARLHRRTWTPPGLSELLRLRVAALRRLFSNHFALVGAFAWEVGHALSVLALAAVGLGLSLRAPATRDVAVILLVVIAYFGAGMALFGVDAYYRSRIPMLPYLFLLGGLGAARLIPGREPGAS